MPSKRTNQLGTGIAAVVLAGIAPASRAANHAIDINEVFSNADGTVQYVELIARANNQTNLPPTRIDAQNADGTVTTLVFDFTAQFPDLNAGETILIASPGFEGAVGFAPDFVMPANGLIPTTNGRVIYFRHSNNTELDAVAYGAFTGNNGVFGAPAPTLPTDGCTSLTRVVNGQNNANDFVNNQFGTPMRNDGTTVTLECPPPGCPGDVSGDGATNTTDLNIVLTDFGCTGAGCAGDVNDDGVTDSTDLNIVLTDIGCVE